MFQQPVTEIQKDSPAWLFFVRTTFAVSTFAMTMGIWFLPVDLWIKGYMAIGLYFTIGSTITLSKSLRDEHESNRLIHKLSEAKTGKILTDYELKS
jgi:hypothetical protein